ncbi:MAG: ATP-binding cassette domain-containing protein [Mycoplasmatales bacterium]
MELKSSKVLICGSNGIGKTTLIEHIYEKHADQIFYVKQVPILFDDFSLEENYQIIENGKIDKNFFYEILDEFKLLISPKQKIKKLSGGQKQLLAIALAFASNYKILILDEPENNVDDERREILRNLICSSEKEIILISHFDYQGFERIDLDEKICSA